jgi:hypothetical protein
MDKDLRNRGTLLLGKPTRSICREGGPQNSIRCSMDKRQSKSTISKKIPQRRSVKRRRAAPRTLDDYNRLPQRSRQSHDSMVKGLSILRTDKTKSLTEVAKQIKIDPRTFLRRAGSSLKKLNGRYVATSRDNHLRQLLIPMRDGVQEIAVRGFRQASFLGGYWAAVQKAIRTGDSSGLEKFRDRSITDADGTTIPLLTDLRELKTLARAGLLSFESIYRRSA